MSNTNNSADAVIKVAKESAAGQKEIVELSTGYKVVISAVPTGILTEVTRQIVPPEIPTIYDEARDRILSNPNDPGYQALFERYETERANAIIDAMACFGITLTEPIPGPDKAGNMPEWEKRLQVMHKRKLIDLDQFDLSDPIERDFVFKRFIVVGKDDFQTIARRAGLSAEGVEEAEDSF